MAFRIHEGESLPDAVRRVAREQIDAAIAEILDRSLPQPEKIHQVRTRCKKLRADAKPLGERLFAENARRIGGRHVRYWDAWQQEQRCRRASGHEPIAASA